MRTSRFLIPVVFTLVACGGVAKAQISLTHTSNTYAQNFNTLLAVNGNGMAYTDNVTIQGLYALTSKGTIGTGAVTETPANYIAQNGSLGIPGLASFGTGFDRAFGCVVADAFNGTDTGFITYGFRFVNDDLTQSITKFTLGYQGEQWRRNTATAQTVNFSYAVFDSNIGGLDTRIGYASDSALDFTSPGFGSGGITQSGLLFTAIKSDVITTTVRPGQELWVRWVDSNDPGGPDHNNGIDDVNLTATFDPTPAPPGFMTALVGSVVGGVHFGGVRWRNRRLRKKQA